MRTLISSGGIFDLAASLSASVQYVLNQRRSMSMEIESENKITGKKDVILVKFTLRKPSKMPHSKERRTKKMAMKKKAAAKKKTFPPKKKGKK